MVDEKRAERSPGDSVHRESAPADAADGELVHFERELADKLEKRLPPQPIDRRELAELLAEVVTVEIRSSSFQGPLPPPAMLAEYEKVMPGLAGRIVDRADKEQTTRHELFHEKASQDRLKITFAGRSRYVGQIAGFVIAMTAVGGGIYLLSQGRDAGGLTSIISAVTALTVVFIGGKVADLYFEKLKADKRQGDERNSKDSAGSQDE